MRNRKYIYMAGPMRGIKDFNFPAFFAAEEKLRKDGDDLEIFNPARRDIEIYGAKRLKSKTGSIKTITERGFSLREALEQDLSWICRNADEVVMLPGWQNSKGARAEKALAEALGLKVRFLRV